MSIKRVKKQLKRYNLFEDFKDLRLTGKELQKMIKNTATLFNSAEGINEYKKYRDLSEAQWTKLKEKSKEHLLQLDNKLYKYLMVGTVSYK